MRTFTLSNGTIVTTEGGSGSITNGCTGRREHRLLYAGFESLVLALACVGYDLDAPAMKEAIDTTIDAIENHLEDN